MKARGHKRFVTLGLGDKGWSPLVYGKVYLTFDLRVFLPLAPYELWRG